MPYCTPAQVKAEFPNEAGKWGDGTRPTDAAIAAVIADQDALIDDALRSRYAVPFSPVPTRIEQISLLFTLYIVRQTLYGKRVKPDEDPDWIRADRLLGELVNGEAVLDAELVEPSEDPSASTGRPQSTGLTRDATFAMEDEW